MSDSGIIDIITIISSLYTSGQALLFLGKAGDILKRNESKFLIRNPRIDAPIDDLLIIRNTLAKYIPEHELRSIDRMKEIHDKNNGTYIILEKIVPGNTVVTKVSGVAILYSLKKKFGETISKGTATAKDINPDVISTRNPRFLYLGFASGDGSLSQGYLCQAIGEKWRRSGNIPLFTRPTNEKSLAFAQKHSFERVPNGGQPLCFSICYRATPIVSQGSRVIFQEIVV